MLNIVLHQPEIPANTGNIGRTCVATGTVLHLIEPLGFSLSEKQLKRAGMDYWQSVDLHRVESMEKLYEEFPNGRFFYLTTKSKRVYTDFKFQENDFIVFGPESRGLPQEYVTQETAITIPMKEGQRSLNLSNSVAIVAYEIVRQIGI